MDNNTLVKQYDRITVFRPGGAGDILLSIPVLQELRRAQPQAKITLFGHYYAAELMKDAKLVDGINRQGTGEARQYDGILETMGRLKGNYDEYWQKEMLKRLYDPDLVLMWSTDAPRASFALEDMGVPRFIVDDWHPPAAMHQAEFMMNTLRNVGFLNRWEYHLGVEPVDFPYVPKLPHYLKTSRAVVIHPGASAPWKAWPLDYFKLLSFELDRMGYNTFVIQGPEAKEDYRRIFVRSLVFRNLTLKELTAILNLKLPYIGNDAGMSHIAGICGAPTVEVFGPTAPEEWLALGKHVRAVRQCMSTPRGDMRTCYDDDCLRSVTIDHVLEGFEAALDSFRRG